MNELENKFEELKINIYEVLQGILGGIDSCMKKREDTDITDDDNDKAPSGDKKDEVKDEGKKSEMINVVE